MLQVVSTEENFENKKNFTIHIISISYYQLEWVQFEKNTMSGVSKFCPKIISYFCLVNEQKSDSNIQTFFPIISFDYFQQNFDFCFWWIESYFTYFRWKQDNYFWTNIRNSNHSEKKKKSIKIYHFFVVQTTTRRSSPPVATNSPSSETYKHVIGPLRKDLYQVYIENMDVILSV